MQASAAPFVPACASTCGSVAGSSAPSGKTNHTPGCQAATTGLSTSSGWRRVDRPGCPQVVHGASRQPGPATSSGQSAAVVEAGRDAVVVEGHGTDAPPSAASRRQRRSPTRAARQVARRIDEVLAHLDRREEAPSPTPTTAAEDAAPPRRRSPATRPASSACPGDHGRATCSTPVGRTTLPCRVDVPGSG